MSHLASDGRPDRLQSLQVGRGAAAIAVVLLHAHLATNAFVATIPEWLASILDKGNLGVDFFFVLSGFIILNSHFDDRMTSRAMHVYVLKRIARIYIPYWPICALVILGYLLLPSLSSVDREWGWLTSIFLIPSRYATALPVAWTLIHEMLFYAIFVLFFLERRIFVITILIWTACIFVQLPTGQVLQPFASTLFDPINIEFVLGMLAALGFRKLPERTGWGFLALGIIIIVSYFMTISDYKANSLLFGFGVSLIVLGSALAEPHLRPYIPRVLIRLGDASYAIYLIHVPLISLSARSAAKVYGLSNWFTGLIFSTVCAVAAGCAYHYLFERPLLKRWRSHVINRRALPRMSTLQT
jgi:exopolysaccharide production protein ExoZ